MTVNTSGNRGRGRPSHYFWNGLLLTGGGFPQTLAKNAVTENGDVFRPGRAGTGRGSRRVVKIAAAGP